MSIESKPYQSKQVKSDKVLFYLIQPPEDVTNDQIEYLLNQTHHMDKNRFKYYERQHNILQNPLFNKEYKTKLKDYFQKNANLKMLCNKFYLKIKNCLTKQANDTDIYCEEFHQSDKELICIQRKEFVWKFVPKANIRVS